MKKSLFFVSLISLLLSSCGREEKSWTLSGPVRVPIDESKIVLQMFPLRIKKMDDSTVVMLTNRKQLGFYNFYTGKLIRSYSIQAFRFDSLLNVTFNKDYKNRREYICDTIGINGDECQMGDYAYDNGKFYVYINCIAHVKYINDSVSLNKFNSNPTVKAMKEKYPETETDIMDFTQFLFVLNDELQLQKCIPIYERSKIATNYSATYQMGFGAKNNYLYVPLLQNNYTPESNGALIDNDNFFYSISKLGINDTSDCKLLLSNKEMDYSDFNFHDYLGPNRVYKNIGDDFLFCNGKEIRSLNNKSLFLKSSTVSKKEWIRNFNANDAKIMLYTDTYIKKDHPTKMEAAFGIDSLLSHDLIRVNRETGSVSRVKLKVNTAISAEITNDQFIYVDKDKENYYFNYISFDEK